MHRTVLLALVALSGAAALAACGDDSTPSAATTAAPAASTTAAPATTAATTSAPTTAATTAASTTTKATAAPSTTAAGPAGTAAVSVALKEWSIEAPKSLKAGKTTFTVANAGTAQHELEIVKGTYAALPKTQAGMVEEDKLPPGDLVLVVDRFAAGATATGTIDLTPGKYVLLCNLGFGPNSHAGKGQVLDIEVTA